MLKRIVRRRVNGKPPGERRQAEEDALRGGLFFEVVWATALKFSRGFTVPGATAVTVAGMFISFFFLARAMKVLPLGTAYAVWTGIGAAGTVLVGIFLFKEPVTVQRIIFTLFLIIGIVGLKFSTT